VQWEGTETRAMRDGNASRDSAILEYVTLCALAVCILKLAKRNVARYVPKYTEPSPRRPHLSPVVTLCTSRKAYQPMYMVGEVTSHTKQCVIPRAQLNGLASAPTYALSSALLPRCHRVTMCVCVCVKERERERVCVCVCVCVR